MTSYRPLTGDHVADLLDTADSTRCYWTNVHGLPAPYIADHRARIVYVDGRLALPRYYEAIRAGMNEILGHGDDATITDLSTRRHTG